VAARKNYDEADSPSERRASLRRYLADWERQLVWLRSMLLAATDPLDRAYWIAEVYDCEQAIGGLADLLDLADRFPDIQPVELLIGNPDE